MNIVILGGGTAGWLTALYADKYFNGSKIKLIESSKVGILGAGEGTTPQIMKTLKFLDIDPFDLIKKTGGSIKNGISFENWNGDGKKYFHGFTEDGMSYFLHELLNKNKNLDKELYSSIISYKNLVDPVNSSFALHFDAFKIAEYLKEKGIERGIKLIKGEYLKCNLKNNKIKEIILEDRSIHKCDFVFDCSGFNRLLIGKLFKSEWVDYQKHLPMKSAVPFMMEKDKDIKPYTQAIAMKYGWVWKIPLQHRFGAGYIFDSDYITVDQAIEEASKLFKQKLKPIREIKFQAGRYKEVWIGNCIAVGLSTGFTEPLEATSVWLSAAQLDLLMNFLSDIKTLNKKSIDTYNRLVANNNDNLLGFLYLHYMTKRNDSPFWKEFKNKNKMPEHLNYFIERIKDSSLNLVDITNTKGNAYFSYTSYLLVSQGLGLISNKKDMTFYKVIPSINEYKDILKQNIQTAIPHNQFLKNL